jgi:hypothetical protein
MRKESKDQSAYKINDREILWDFRNHYFFSYNTKRYAIIIESITSITGFKNTIQNKGKISKWHLKTIEELYHFQICLAANGYSPIEVLRWK